MTIPVRARNRLSPKSVMLLLPTATRGTRLYLRSALVNDAGSKIIGRGSEPPQGLFGLDKIDRPVLTQVIQSCTDVVDVKPELLLQLSPGMKVIGANQCLEDERGTGRLFVSHGQFHP